MKRVHEPPDSLWQLFQKLRQRQFPLSPDDYEALRQALRAGFGWSSRESLRDLCCTIWAKSLREREVLIALFEQLVLVNDEDWQLPSPGGKRTGVSSQKAGEGHKDNREEIEKKESSQQTLAAQPQSGLPSITFEGIDIPARPFVFVPQLPLTYREVAQAWRRLRRPVRVGPPVELDIEGTVAHRCQTGVASPVVLRPRRRNLARLLLLVDRQGSMTPFHRFIEEISDVIQQAGRLNETAIYYFHNVPAEGADESVLGSLEKEPFPALDTVLSQIEPLVEGYVYDDPDLLSSQPLKAVLEEYADGAAVVLLSDAGAARRTYNGLRLLDTIAFFKALRLYTRQYAWLNPLPRRYWAGTTAAQIARHVPMLALDSDGIHRAVNVLRGHQYTIERPL